MQEAEVKIWGKLVGTITWDKNQALATFQYDSKFKQLGWDLAPLKMPIADRRNKYSFPEATQNINTEYNTFRGLPGLLADALPDNYGKQLINHWLAQEGRAEDTMNPVEMLGFIGSRGMGALEFGPSLLKEDKQPFSIKLDTLVSTNQKILYPEEAFVTRLGKEGRQEVLQMLKISTSAGGARPKAVIAFNEKTGEIMSGHNLAPKGFEHWLIKLDGVSEVQLGSSHDYGRVEMAYYKMAMACGIKMMPSRLLEENGRAHFMTKRFDRESNDVKHHVQTFCSLKHFNYNLVNSFSYEQLFDCMQELNLSYEDIEQMFRRMVFNVIAKNCDDHTKNFSFLLKEGGKWELSPAYDLCHAFRPGSEWVSQHALSINGKRNKITKEDLLIIGEFIQCKNTSDIVDEINEIVNRWKSFAQEVMVKPALRDKIAVSLLNLKK